ncbi:SufB/SufD family protein [Catonella massiliensis]|uniref:SufD family Fe-S cluster assembly protein n=1 Tax=Catonella massiliensis TaxID=2799636 RepID=A0ABS1IYT2_9FIRM|nr:SufD family Fe-S cluster assembly protein [Catonella massiliensis]MBK5897051.1 SufD family Fe-S cluster assembly protein [Catonella massiliensis]
MKFELKGAVNYLPAITYGKMKNSYADIDFNYEINKNNDIDLRLQDGVDILESGALFEEIVAKADFVKTGMEALNLDSKAGGDSLEDENRRDREVKDAPSTDIVRNAIKAAGIPLKVITTKKGVKVDKPVKITYRAGEENSLNSHIIYVSEGSELTLIEVFESENKENLLGLQTRVYVCENASIKLVRVNLLSESTDHFDDLGFHLENDAKAELVQLELGGKRSYVGVRTELVGRKSEYRSATGYLCKGDSLLDMNFVTNEWGKKVSSNMDASGVLLDNSTKVYRGTIDFKEGAKGASGFEKEDTLLFSPSIINKSVPLILCHEEDVEGDHGATIGRIDEKLLFYIKSRGIDEKAAKQLMTEAYINAVTEQIGDDETEGKVIKYVSEVFNDEQ